MEAPTDSAGNRMKVARTGAPMVASSVFTPTARNRVLLPDMFEPLTSRIRPAPPRLRLLRTHAAPDSSGCPMSFT